MRWKVTLKFGPHTQKHRPSVERIIEGDACAVERFISQADAFGIDMPACIWRELRADAEPVNEPAVIWRA
jgi:hypothetical protein